MYIHCNLHVYILVINLHHLCYTVLIWRKRKGGKVRKWQFRVPRSQTPFWHVSLSCHKLLSVSGFSVVTSILAVYVQIYLTNKLHFWEETNLHQLRYWIRNPIRNEILSYLFMNNSDNNCGGKKDIFFGHYMSWDLCLDVESTVEHLKSLRSIGVHSPISTRGQNPRIKEGA